MAQSILSASGIYSICHRLSGKLYIGSAVCFAKRWSQHRSDLNNAKHHSGRLQNAWSKYGASEFDFTVIELVSNKEHLLLREQEWLDKLQPFYNICMTAGNCLGIKHSLETRARQSARQKGRAGKPMSDETKAKLSTAKKGKKQSPEAVAKAAAARVGMRHSAEAKAKMSVSQKGRVLTQEHKDKLSASGKKRTATAETKAKMSAALMGNKRTAGLNLSDEHRAMISIVQKGRPHTKEHVEKIAASRRAGTALKRAALLAAEEHGKPA